MISIMVSQLKQKVIGFTSPFGNKSQAGHSIAKTNSKWLIDGQNEAFIKISFEQVMYKYSLRSILRSNSVAVL